MEREHLTRNLFKRQLARNKFPKRIVATAWRTDGQIHGWRWKCRDNVRPRQAGGMPTLSLTQAGTFSVQESCSKFNHQCNRSVETACTLHQSELLQSGLHRSVCRGLVYSSLCKLQSRQSDIKFNQFIGNEALFDWLLCCYSTLSALSLLWHK